MLWKPAYTPVKLFIGANCPSYTGIVLGLFRAAPQSTTSETLSQLLFGRQIRTRLDLNKPFRDGRVEQQLQQQKTSHDRIAKEKKFHKGEITKPALYM